MTVLHTYRARPVSLAEALSPVAGHLGAEVVALLYTPTECRLARLQGGRLTGPDADTDASPVDLADVFEARVFGESGELRWCKDRTAGTAALLVEGDVDPSVQPLYRRTDRVRPVEILDRAYLLWGEGMAPTQPLAPGWSWLATARIGAWAVPLAGVGPDDRVVLQAREYLAVLDDQHGNVGVADERLRALGIASFRQEPEVRS